MEDGVCLYKISLFSVAHFFHSKKCIIFPAIGFHTEGGPVKQVVRNSAFLYKTLSGSKSRIEMSRLARIAYEGRDFLNYLVKKRTCMCIFIFHNKAGARA